MSVLRLSPSLATLAALLLAGCASAMSVSPGPEVAAVPPGGAAPGEHPGAGPGRPLGPCRLSQGRGPRPHRGRGARPVPPALQYQPRPARRHHHASRRPVAADRADPQGRCRTARTISASPRSRFRRPARPRDRVVRRPRAGDALRRSGNRRPLRHQRLCALRRRAARQPRRAARRDSQSAWRRPGRTSAGGLGARRAQGGADEGGSSGRRYLQAGPAILAFLHPRTMCRPASAASRCMARTR